MPRVTSVLCHVSSQ